MDVVDEFLRSYAREIDFNQEARLCGQACEQQLRAAGKRAIVTYRAKNPQRLGEKLRKRNQDKPYTDAQGITDDIIDLAGVRVALYFPTDQKEVDRIITNLFAPARPSKKFPDGLPKSAKNYTKQFSGYHATHYLVRLKSDALGQDQQRYTAARIEIQVASVLMHAWAEVEHDLSYKPLSGHLSIDEHAILDELNGMVLAGDIALQRLRRAFERRVDKGDAEFTNHYELAAFLYRELQQNHGDYPLGRVDHLFQLLKAFGIDKADAVKPFLSAVITDPDHDRPIAEQLIDLFIADHPDRYAAYEDIRSRSTQAPEERTPATQAALGAFITEWWKLEHLLQQHTQVAPFRLHLAAKALPPALREEYDWLRRARNDIVHGFNVPPTDRLGEISEQTSMLHDALQQHFGAPKRPKKKPPQ
jgi:ppGpp synthetase/RelA/SpoT-type nucleotidyltranferase